MKQHHPTTGYIIALLFLYTVGSGCHNYYMTLAVMPSDSHAMQQLDSLKLQNRYFILRNGPDAYYMRHLQLNPEHTVLTCELDTLPSEHQLHLVNGRNNNRRYRKYDPVDLQVLNEVHLYIQPDNNLQPGAYTLSLSQVKTVEVIQKDRYRTTSSYILGGIGYTIGIAALITAIILATKSSCPFVSAYDGQQFTLQGEIFGGAVYPQLARHDYLPLHMAPDANGQLQLKISNELQERQYTDVANLLVITHNKNTRMLTDETGHIFPVGNGQLPLAAWLNKKAINLQPLTQHHDRLLQYMDDTSQINGRNELLLQFNKPAGVTNGKLVLALKNSYWLDYLYGELAKGFGRYYALYIKKQNNKSPAELLKWVKDQQIPLEISIQIASGWKSITSLTTIGPVATREMVVPLPDLATEEKTITVRLSSGFMFWEIDRAAVDFTPNDAFVLEELSPVSAVDENNKNVLPLLQKEDGLYCEQPVPGNIATLTYQYTPVTNAGATQTFILHTKGYYTHVRHFSGGINKPFLKKFKQPDAFTAFSLQRFKQLNNAQLETLTKK